MMLFLWAAYEPVRDVGQQHPRRVRLLVLILQVHRTPVEGLVVRATLDPRPQLVQAFARLPTETANSKTYSNSVGILGNKTPPREQNSYSTLLRCTAHVHIHTPSKAKAVKHPSRIDECARHVFVVRRPKPKNAHHSTSTPRKKKQKNRKTCKTRLVLTGDPIMHTREGTFV